MKVVILVQGPSHMQCTCTITTSGVRTMIIDGVHKSLKLHAAATIIFAAYVLLSLAKS